MYDRKKLDELKSSLEKWEATSLKKALSQLPERKAENEFITTSSEPINRVYTPQMPLAARASASFIFKPIRNNAQSRF